MVGLPVVDLGNEEVVGRVSQFQPGTGIMSFTVKFANGETLVVRESSASTAVDRIVDIDELIMCIATAIVKRPELEGSNQLSTSGGTAGEKRASKRRKCSRNRRTNKGP